MKLEICITTHNKRYRWCEKVESIAKLKEAFKKALKIFDQLLGK